MFSCIQRRSTMDPYFPAGTTISLECPRGIASCEKKRTSPSSECPLPGEKLSPRSMEKNRHSKELWYTDDVRVHYSANRVAHQIHRQQRRQSEREQGSRGYHEVDARLNARRTPVARIRRASPVPQGTHCTHYVACSTGGGPVPRPRSGERDGGGGDRAGGWREERRNNGERIQGYQIALNLMLLVSDVHSRCPKRLLTDQSQPYTKASLSRFGSQFSSVGSGATCLPEQATEHAKMPQRVRSLRFMARTYGSTVRLGIYWRAQDMLRSRHIDNAVNDKHNHTLTRSFVSLVAVMCHTWHARSSPAGILLIDCFEEEEEEEEEEETGQAGRANGTLNSRAPTSSGSALSVVSPSALRAMYVRCILGWYALKKNQFFQKGPPQRQGSDSFATRTSRTSITAVPCVGPAEMKAPRH